MAASLPLGYGAVAVKDGLGDDLVVVIAHFIFQSQEVSELNAQQVHLHSG